MRTIDQLKVAVLVVAVAIWAWGARTGNHTYMLVGICFVVVAFALRLIPRSRDRDGL
jgi:4-hydroxybenzoate polyprenyltransferase